MSEKKSPEAHAIIAALGLKPHPEGGHYRETFRDSLVDATGRSVGTAIYYLLQAGEVSHWHRVDASEIWFYHAGSSLALSISRDGRKVGTQQLGPDLAAGERPQIVIEAGHWQSAASLGGWTLVSCTVSPGFAFSAFEMAPPGWKPGAGNPGK